MKKKILFLLDSLGLGGSEKTAINLAKLIKKHYAHKFQIDFFVLGKKDKRISKKLYMIPKEFNVFFLYEKNYSAYKKLFYTYKTLKKLSEYLKEKKLHYDYVVSFHDYSNLVNVLLKKNLNHIAIVSERKYSKHYFGKKFFLVKYLLKYIFDSANKVIVNDIEIKESVRFDIGSKNREIYVINNWLNINDYHNDKIKINLKGSINFVTVGRLTREKNTKDILIAFSKTNYQAKNYHLYIIGEGPEKENLINLAKELNIYDNITFLGQVLNILEVLKNFDIFVFSSLNEGFPNAVLEAMYVGLPIISYHFKAGISTLTCNGKYGILVPLGDTDELSHYMNLFAEDRNLREEFSNLSRKRAIEFSNEIEYIKNFLRVLNNE